MNVRTHKISIEASYEGEPLDAKTLDIMLRTLGNILAVELRVRYEGADGIFTAGLHHTVDYEEEGS